MMTSLDNRIDGLIARMKRRGSMGEFVFLPAFPPHKTPNPVRTYTVAVENHEIEGRTEFIGGRIGRASIGYIANVELRLRVYAPERTSGSALLRASSMVMDALESSDSERWLTGVYLSGIGFDTASRTEYRDVVARLKVPLSEEAGA